MSEHPISSLMETAMRSIKEMIDVNTIVGDAVNTSDGGVIIPISKVSFGFAAGGGEYSGKKEAKDENQSGAYPFAGGSGAGVSITPVAFMVVKGEEYRLVPANINCSIDRIVELIPNLMQKAEKLVSQKLCKNDFSNDKNDDEEDSMQSRSEAGTQSRSEAGTQSRNESGTQSRSESGMQSRSEPSKQFKKSGVSTQSKKHISDYQSFLGTDAGSDPDFPPPS
jgi:sporulation protein YtfJ